MANALAGLKKTPKDWTWHHGEHVPLMLVLKDLHRAVRQTGGYAPGQIRRAKGRSMIEYEPEGPVREVEVAALEARLPQDLPPDYRAWLKDTNGAQLDAVPVADGLVDMFAGVLDTGGGSGLVQLQRSRAGGFGAWVPSEYLIVSGGAGGVVCLKVTGADRGSVWWADYDLGFHLAPEDDDAADDPIPGIMSRLADSWTRFLTDFEPRQLTPEDRAEIDEIVARSR